VKGGQFPEPPNLIDMSDETLSEIIAEIGG